MKDLEDADPMFLIYVLMRNLDSNYGAGGLSMGRFIGSYLLEPWLGMFAISDSNDVSTLREDFQDGDLLSILGDTKACLDPMQLKFGFCKELSLLSIPELTVIVISLMDDLHQRELVGYDRGRRICRGVREIFGGLPDHLDSQISLITNEREFNNCLNGLCLQSLRRELSRRWLSVSLDSSTGIHPLTEADRAITDADVFAH